MMPRHRYKIAPSIFDGKNKTKGYVCEACCIMKAVREISAAKAHFKKVR